MSLFVQLKREEIPNKLYFCLFLDKLNLFLSPFFQSVLSDFSIAVSLLKIRNTKRMTLSFSYGLKFFKVEFELRKRLIHIFEF